MKSRIAVLSAVMTVTLAAQSSRAPQLDSIHRDRLRADLFFLAGDRLQGRLTDSPGNALAADWIVSRFERLGLIPGGHAGTFEHRYQLMTADLGHGNLASIGNAAAVTARADLRLLQDFYPHRFSGSGEVEAPVVFAGFGIDSPERRHDDYKNSVRGRVALVLDREPGVNDPASSFDGVVAAEAATPLRKILAAQARGAVGVIFVEDIHNLPQPTAQ